MAAVTPFSVENQTQLPSFAKRRSAPWIYCGWLERPSNPSDVAQDHFDQLVRRSLQSNHGEVRGVDVYPEGATCYWSEEKGEYPLRERIVFNSRKGDKSDDY